MRSPLPQLDVRGHQDTAAAGAAAAAAAAGGASRHDGSDIGRHKSDRDGRPTSVEDH